MGKFATDLESHRCRIEGGEGCLKICKGLLKTINNEVKNNFVEKLQQAQRWYDIDSLLIKYTYMLQCGNDGDKMRMLLLNVRNGHTMKCLGQPYRSALFVFRVRVEYVTMR